MSAIYDALTGDSSPPSYVIVEGGLYFILTDFRHWMRVESTILDTAVKDEDKAVMLLSSFTPAYAAGQLAPSRGYPFSLDAAVKALQGFYTRGQKAATNDAPANGGRQERSYDYLHDIALVYAGFRHAYGIDLSVEQMHWWVFSSLFAGLPTDTAIKALMAARVEKVEKPTPAQIKAHERIALPKHIRYTDAAGKRAGHLDAWVARMKAKKESGKTS